MSLSDFFEHHTKPPFESAKSEMADEALSIYDEIEIEDMTFDPNLQIYHYPCPCGDRFEIVIDDLRDGEEIAVCPSCSLMIRVIFDVVSISPLVHGSKVRWTNFLSLIFQRTISRNHPAFQSRHKSSHDTDIGTIRL